MISIIHSMVCWVGVFVPEYEMDINREEIKPPNPKRIVVE